MLKMNKNNTKKTNRFRRKYYVDGYSFEKYYPKHVRQLQQRDKRKNELIYFNMSWTLSSFVLQTFYQRLQSTSRLQHCQTISWERSADKGSINFWSAYTRELNRCSWSGGLSCANTPNRRSNSMAYSSWKARGLKSFDYSRLIRRFFLRVANSRSPHFFRLSLHFTVSPPRENCSFFSPSAFVCPFVSVVVVFLSLLQTNLFLAGQRGTCGFSRVVRSSRRNYFLMAETPTSASRKIPFDLVSERKWRRPLRNGSRCWRSPLDIALTRAVIVPPRASEFSNHFAFSQTHCLFRLESSLPGSERVRN